MKLLPLLILIPVIMPVTLYSLLQEFALLKRDLRVLSQLIPPRQIFEQPLKIFPACPPPASDVPRELRWQDIQPCPSMWWAIAQGEQLSVEQKKRMYIRDCNSLVVHNYEDAGLPKGNLRIATYNVHHWKDPLGNPNFKKIKKVIKIINAEILVLQEFEHAPGYNTIKQIKDLGYDYGGEETFCIGIKKKRPFGNIIFSKYSFASKPELVQFKHNKPNSKESRCYVRVEVSLPFGGNLVIYGTHLEVKGDDNQYRLPQIQEILERARKEKTKNVAILGDFNAICPQDYEYSCKGKNVLELLKNENKRFGFLTQSSVCDACMQNGFQDCFAIAKLPSPHFTVWSGIRVDFIMLSSTWNFPILGCYTWFNPASDHIPVIMDVKF